jgi:hypothetical protein
MAMLTRCLLIALVAVAGWACSRFQEDPRKAEREFWAVRANTDRLEAFVLANVRFILLHEMAHSVFSDYKVPIGGKPEDAADRLAASLMTPPRQEGRRPEDELTASPTASDLVWVVYYWINLGQSGSQQRKEIAWFDEHGIDEQRGFQVLCLLYGSDPERFAQVAEEYGLPEGRRRSCVGEARDNNAAWLDLIGGNIADAEERRRNIESFEQQDRLLTSQPPGVLYLDAQPTELFMNLPWFTWNSYAFLRRHAVLEDGVTRLLSLRQRPGAAIPSLIATGCDGLANAMYVPESREIVVCYPLVDQVSWSGRRLLWDLEQERRAASQ